MAYLLLSFASYRHMETVKNGHRASQLTAFALMSWSFFMVLYFVIRHDDIVTQPLNKVLNVFETATNYTVAILILLITLKK